MTSNVMDHLASLGVADTTSAGTVGQVVDAASNVDLPSITFKADTTLIVGDPSGPVSDTWSVVEDEL